MTARKFSSLFLLTGALALAGCGHSDEEMAAKDREIAAVNARLQKSEQERANLTTSLDNANKEIAGLKKLMEEKGIAYEGLKGSLAGAEAEAAKLKQAVAEYEQRLKQLEEMKKRFAELRARLEKLTSAGLKVVVRNNRMVIQLPGDVLFDSGLDALKNEGKKILKQVADVVNSDATLKTRLFQVAGHTDFVEYAPTGVFRDNWGLSVARARQVVVFLTTPIEPKAGQPKPPAGIPNGGGLDPKNWSAAGYGKMDPIAGTVEKQTPEEMQKNRRVELVLQPSLEEMLNLKDFGGPS
jgi:chemotaxis protein MotB